jgi:hypothetical protein
MYVVKSPGPKMHAAGTERLAPRVQVYLISPDVPYTAGTTPDAYPLKPWPAALPLRLVCEGAMASAGQYSGQREPCWPLEGTPISPMDRQHLSQIDTYKGQVK